MAEEACGFTKRLMMLKLSIRITAVATVVLSCIAFPTFADLNERLCESAWYPGLGIRLPEPVPGRRLWDAADSGDLVWMTALTFMLLDQRGWRKLCRLAT